MEFNKYFAIGCIWIGVAVAACFDSGSVIILGPCAMIATMSL